MNSFYGVYIPDDDNYNHALCVYVPSLHLFFEEFNLFGVNFPIYYSGKYKDIYLKYSNNIVSDFEIEKIEKIKEIKYREDTLYNSELMLRIKKFLMFGKINEFKNEALYIKRHDRRISNFCKLQEYFYNFNIPLKEIDFSNLSFEEQIETANSSKFIIGVHGAGLTNLMFMEQNSFVLEIDFFNWGFNCYEHLASILGMCNYFRICDEKTKNKNIESLEFDFAKFNKNLINILKEMKNTFPHYKEENVWEL
jgi:hypothetical protein